jgi:hypothetical protein
MKRRPFAALAPLSALTCLSVIALTPVALAADRSQDPSNPNCSPGVKGCTANYPTVNLSKSQPPRTETDPPSDPNCATGEKGCATNAPTSGITKDNPVKRK